MQAARWGLVDSRREKEVSAGRAELGKGRLSSGEVAATMSFHKGR